MNILRTKNAFAMHFALFLKGFIEVNKTNFFGRWESDFNTYFSLKEIHDSKLLKIMSFGEYNRLLLNSCNIWIIHTIQAHITKILQIQSITVTTTDCGNWLWKSHEADPLWKSCTDPHMYIGKWSDIYKLS